MGLLVGGSVLTLFELIDFIFFKLWETLLLSRKDRRRMQMAEKRNAAIEANSVVLQPLTAEHNVYGVPSTLDNYS